jgi:hypothetical protein
MLRQAGLSRAAQSLSQRGPLLVTHSGLSGPAILRLSAFGARVLHLLECVVHFLGGEGGVLIRINRRTRLFRIASGQTSPPTSLIALNHHRTQQTNNPLPNKHTKHTHSYKARISVDWAPDLELAEVVERLSRAKAAYPKKAVATFCPLPLPGTKAKKNTRENNTP